MFNKPDLKVASAAVLRFLDQLSPIVKTSSGTDRNAGATPSLNACRKRVDEMTKQLEKISLDISILLNAIDETKESQRLVTQEQSRLLAEANQLIASKPSCIHLPFEILSAIAEYASLRPTSMAKAIGIKSSGCKWGEIVLGHSYIDLHHDSIKSPSLSDRLYASSPAKLDLYLDRSITQAEFQLLLHFCKRWRGIHLLDDWRGEALCEALSSVPRPNCPPPSVDGNRRCEDHSVMSSLNNLFAGHDALPLFSGLLKNIRHLGITEVKGTVDFLGIASEAPSLSILTIWKSKGESSQGPLGIRTQVLLPNLRQVNIVILSGAPDLSWLQSVFLHLDGSNVEGLSLRGFCLKDPYAKNREESRVMKFLEVIFPSVKSLALRMKTSSAGFSQLGMQMVQRALLGTLIPTDLGRGDSGNTLAIFSQLDHLSVNLDPTPEGLNTLIQVLE